MTEKRLWPRAEEILSSLYEKSRRVPVKETERLVPKTHDSSTIWEQCEDLSGINISGSAKSGISIPASPHRENRYSESNFRQIAEKVFEKEVVLPDGVEEFPAHLVLWWKKVSGENPNFSDFIDISKMPAEERQDFKDVIKAQFVKAYELIEGLGEIPFFWGGVGNERHEDRGRSKLGLGPGAPSNRTGHGHGEGFSNFESGTEYRDDLDVSQRYKYIDPLRDILFSECGDAARFTLEKMFKDNFGELNERSVGEVAFSEERLDKRMDGYRIRFNKEQSVDKVLDLLIEFSGTFDSIYQAFMESFETFHKTGEVGLEDIYLKMKAKGVDGEVSMRFATDKILDLVKQIKPTYGQLTTWRDEFNEKDLDVPESINNQINRYEKLWERMKDRYLSEENNEKQRVDLKDITRLSELMAYDTIRPPDMAMAGFTNWSARFSYSWYLGPDSLEIKDSDLLVKDLIIAPNLTSTKTVERLFGHMLVRK